jgi:hypothetical protein
MGPQIRDFEQQLEDELRLLLDPFAARTIPAWRMPAQDRRAQRLAGGAGAALGAKIATGLVVAVVAAGAAGATTEIVITRSANPADWARNVQQQVQGTQRSSGSHSQPTSGSHPSPSSVAGGSPGASPAVNPPALPSASAPAVPTVSPLPLPSPSVPTLP